MQPTFCIMPFCLHGLKQALRCNLCRARPALLCALELTDNICTAFWLFGEWKHTSSSDPGCLVGLVYRGGGREKLKKQRKSVKQANIEVGWSWCCQACTGSYMEVQYMYKKLINHKPSKWLQEIQSRWKLATNPELPHGAIISVITSLSFPQIHSSWIQITLWRTWLWTWWEWESVFDFK